MAIIFFLILLGMSAFFSGSETSLLSLNRLQLKKMESERPVRTERIIKLLSKPRSLFFTILAGNTLVNTAASACVTVAAVSHFGAKGVGIAIGFMLIVLLLLGEIIPKTCAYMYSEGFASFAVRPLGGAIVLLAPLRKLLLAVTDSMINALGYIVPKDSSEITEEELKSLVKIGHREGVVEEEEKKMIYGAFDFRGLTVKDIMTPKFEVRAIDIAMAPDRAAAYARDAKHSRLPVYDRSLDNVLGVVYAKDLLLAGGAPVRGLMKGAYIIPESKKINLLLADLQKKAIQMAVVKDEYGTTTGIVTMEDILEEIVGEITDEYDKDEPPITRLGKGAYSVSGLLHINDANEKLGLGIETEEVDTVGGFVSLVMQKIPSENEEFVSGGYRYKVVKVENQRVKEVLISRI
ncbi:MAG: CNNM domain-containing protein [Candidatus Omnitrophota bacterium]